MTGVTPSRTKTLVSIALGATAFSCLCEPCLERAGESESSLREALGPAVVHGTLAADADVGFFRCRLGHELVVRRAARAPTRSGSDRLLRLAGAR